MSETGDVVVTPFGMYHLCAFEVQSFVAVYGQDWAKEIVKYAESEMESAWLEG